MNEQPENTVLDAELQSLSEANPTPAESESLSRVMRDRWQALEEEGQLTGRTSVTLPPQKNGKGVWRTRWFAATGFAASTAAIFLIGWMIQPQGVFAQAIAAINAARTIHAVAERFDESGKSTGTDAEIWYDSVQGVREDDTRADGMKVRVDNGVHQWIYRESANTVVKGSSVDPVGVIEEMLTPMKSIEKHGGKRDLSLDKKIDGDLCVAYRSELKGSAGKFRMIGWVDAKSRMRRFEEQRLRDGRWMTDERVEMYYDQPIKTSRFVANFPDARLIDRTQLNDRTHPSRTFGSGKIVARAERLKIQIEVHDVRRLENDIVMAVWKSTIDKSVTDKYGKFYPGRTSFKSYGDADWASNGRRLADHSWQKGVNPISIARWSHEGVDYEWTLLLRASRMMNKEKKMSAGFYLYARQEWQAELKAEGKPWMLSPAHDLLEIPIPEKTKTLDRVLSEAYDQIDNLGDGTRSGSPVLNMGSIPWSKEKIAKEIAAGLPEDEATGMSTRKQGFTFNTTLPQWQAAIEERIQDALR